ncbi:MAG: hypothetical protein HPY85_16535 [Anaerolineae bacterium]|nr:hypothetical protein [Anaerolineae bacterium]
MTLITTCLHCGSQFQWDETFWKEGGMPDCPACGFNNMTGQPGRGEGPVEYRYRKMARELAQQYGPLRSVEYLSHFPNFEINFVFDTHTLYSGRRRGQYDIHFLSLGYIGEGPRYARAFLDELGFSMTAKEIDAIQPGDVIQLDAGKVVVHHNAVSPTQPPANPPRPQAQNPVPVPQPAVSTTDGALALAAVGAFLVLMLAVFLKNWWLGIAGAGYLFWFVVFHSKK